MSIRPIIVCLALLGLAACAAKTVPWMNPDLPRDQWGKDYSGCRYHAEREAGVTDYDAGESKKATSEFDRYDMKRKADAGVAACMRDRGYVPAPRN